MHLTSLQGKRSWLCTRLGWSDFSGLMIEPYH